MFVDDQSTDFSYELAESYERRFPDKMAVMRAGTKCYAGGCRNIGIDYPVECEYVYFIDSDDYLYSDISLRKIYDALNEKPDMLLIGWCQDINGKIFTNSKYCVFDPNSDNLASTIWSASWARVTRRSVTMKFLENCMRAEDTY